MTQQSPYEDIDPTETQEWLESIESVLHAQGPARAHFLLEKLVDFTRRSGAYLPFKPNTAYLNTISRAQEPDYPGDRSLELRNEAYMRWNALAMVVQANRTSSEYGGHIASYASAATLYEVGFNHFWRARSAAHPGDMVFMQGHSTPGIYARAYLEGRLDEGQLQRFRQEVRGGGLSSYPHPWLMPDFWQFPTVSMGLGPDDGDLSGAVRALSGASRDRPAVGSEDLGVSWATARWTNRSRWARSPCRCARGSTTSSS